MNQFRLGGISVRMNNTEESLQQIPQLWERFFKEGVLQQLLGNTQDRPIYEAYYDYDSDASGHYTLMLGTRVDDGSRLPEGMSEKMIPMATYAVFDVNGPDKIKDAWQEIRLTKIESVKKKENVRKNSIKTGIAIFQTVSLNKGLSVLFIGFSFKLWLNWF